MRILAVMGAVYNGVERVYAVEQRDGRFMDLSLFLTQPVKAQNSSNGELSQWDCLAGMFTKEFKLAAVRRLERGVSIAEVARGVEVNPERAAPLAA